MPSLLAGAAGFTVTLAEGDDLDACFGVRRRVFVEEQQISECEEWDGLDPSCLHLLARREGRAVGTARLRRVGEFAKAERVAVLAEDRRAGVGAALMDALEREAARLGAPRVVLHAQESSVAFYTSLGYASEGPPFEEAGIPHRRMVKAVGPTAPLP